MMERRAVLRSSNDKTKSGKNSAEKSKDSSTLVEQKPENGTKPMLTVFAERGIGFACKKGLKKGIPNQDDFFAYSCDEWGLYGVFDGHGACGHQISNFVQWHFPTLINKHKLIDIDPKEALRQSFIEMNNLITWAASTGKFECHTSGTTATILFHKRKSNKLYMAHVGDSKAVLCRIDDNGNISATDLTKDHKPELPGERLRIENGGGEVLRLPGHNPYRVFVKGKNYPGLAMSRSLGDTCGHEAGVSPEPDVAEHDVVEGRDLFIVICSDGVWEFISSKGVVDTVYRFPVHRVRDAAQNLAAEAWRRWLVEVGYTVDDITVQIIHLFVKKLPDT